MDVTVTSLGLGTKVCARCSPPTRSLTEFSKSRPGIHRCALSGPAALLGEPANQAFGLESPAPVRSSFSTARPRTPAGRCSCPRKTSTTTWSRPTTPVCFPSQCPLFATTSSWARELQVLFPPFGRSPHCTQPTGPLYPPPSSQQITSKNLHTKSFSCRHLAWSGRRQGEAPELHGIDHWPASTHRRQGPRA